MDLVTQVLIWASWDLVLFSTSGPHVYLVTLVLTWASSGPIDSGPYLGIIGTWILSYIPGPHLDMVTVVPPVPHLKEVTGSHRDIIWTW